MLFILLFCYFLSIVTHGEINSSCCRKFFFFGGGGGGITLFNGKGEQWSTTKVKLCNEKRNNTHKSDLWCTLVNCSQLTNLIVLIVFFLPFILNAVFEFFRVLTIFHSLKNSVSHSLILPHGHIHIRFVIK